MTEKDKKKRLKPNQLNYQLSVFLYQTGTTNKCKKNKKNIAIAYTVIY